MSLDTYLPNYFIREVHHFAVRATAEEAYRAGFDGFFPKPIKTGEFLDLLKDIVG